MPVYNGSQREPNIAQTHLHSAFEESDLRIIVHIKVALEAGYYACVVISNDTDVIVALLYHMQMFLQCNLHGLWVRAGVADTIRYILLNTLYGCLGDQPALHSLIGCDITSKVGPKKAALKQNQIHL